MAVLHEGSQRLGAFRCVALEGMRLVTDDAAHSVCNEDGQLLREGVSEDDHVQWPRASCAQNTRLSAYLECQCVFFSGVFERGHVYELRYT